MKSKLNDLKDIPFERWPEYGVVLKAVSANASGIVNSGITNKGIYFFRSWSKDYKDSHFQIG